MAADTTLKLAFVLSATDKMSRIVDEAVKKSTDRLSSFERTTSRVGRTMMKSGGLMAGAGAAIGGAMFGAAKSTANYGDEVLKASQRVGVGVEEWQRMAYAAKQSDIESNVLADTFSKLSKRVSDAAGGNKTYMQTFKDLGIQVKDVTGKLRSPMDVFNDLSEVFHNVPDGAEKTALAMELFGDTGAKLIPFLSKGKVGFKELGDQAEQMGLVLSEAAILAGKKFNDDIKTLTGSFSGLKMQLGTALMPVLNELVTKITAGIQKVTDWARANPELMETIAKVGMVLATLLVTVGTASVLIGGLTFVVGQFSKVFRAVSNVIKVGTTIVNACKNGMLLFRIQYAALVVWQKVAAAAQWLFNKSLYGCPVVWIVAGIAAIIAAVVLLVKYWDNVVAFFKKIWDRIINIFKNAWEAIKSVWGAVAGWFLNLWNSVKNGISKAWDGIKNLFLSYTPQGLIIKHWDKIKNWFSNLWDSVKKGISKAWDGIKNLFLSYTPQGLIIKHWDKIKNWFSNLWDSVKNGIVSAWNGIKDFFSSLNPVKWISDIWQGVSGYFSNLATRFYEWGQNLINSLWDGIKSVAKKAWDGIKSVGSGIASGFKSLFGINSPSRLFTEYGINITQGLVVGIERGGNQVESATEGMAAQATRGITQNMQATTVNASRTNYAGNSGVNITYSPQITFSGAVTTETRDEFSKMLRQHATDIIAIIRSDNDNMARLSFNT